MTSVARQVNLLSKLQIRTMAREKVAIIGSGLVGKSWAMIFAAAGYEVSMYDSDPDQLAKEPSINDITH